MDTAKRFYCDVAVCGGGPAGAAAAIAAGREGKSVILMELRESLGGLCTNGYITGIAGNVDGLAKEWVERLAAEGHAVVRPHLPVVEPEFGKMMLEEMVLQSGARILYGTHVVDCTKEDGKIKSVIAYCKSGKVEIFADAYIDCTGDADLIYAAGVPFEISSGEYCGLDQSVTMGFRLAYVNYKKFMEANKAFRKSKDFEYGNPKKSSLIVFKQFQAIAEGKLHELLSPGNIVYPMPGRDQECMDVTLDATHTFDCHNDDVVDLTRQIVDQHRKVVWFVDFLREYVPGFENCELEALAPMNGVRDSRYAKGEYFLRAEDLATARKFEDGIWQHSEPFDTHVPTPGFHCAIRHINTDKKLENSLVRPCQDEKDYMMHPFVRPLKWEARTDPRDWSEIPFRALICKGVDNLMVAGRCFSADFHAMGNIRIIGPSMGMGQAAGIGCSMYIDKKLNAIRELDGVLVRKRMIELGVGLDHAPTGYWETVRNFKGEPTVNAGDMIEIRNEKGETPGF